MFKFLTDYLEYLFHEYALFLLGLVITILLTKKSLNFIIKDIFMFRQDINLLGFGYLLHLALLLV